MTTEQWVDVVVRGEDATSYLQSQSTQDVTGTGPWWSAVLQPDSVIVAVARVSRANEGFVLCVPSGVDHELLTRLQRFSLRQKIEFSLEPCSNPPFPTLAERIDSGFPGAAELRHQLLPHSLGRAWVDEVVSFTKGCFTGQELVGRLDVRGGNTPWQLRHGRHPDVSTVNQWLKSAGPEGPQGVTSFDVESGTWMGIAHRSLVGEP